MKNLNVYLLVLGVIVPATALATFPPIVPLPETLVEVSRGMFDNTSSENPTENAVHQGVTSAIQGSTGLVGNVNGDFLSEFSVGHTVAPHTAYGSYADDVIKAVRCQLFVDGDAKFNELNGSTAAFRYKLLLYNNEGGTDVTSHFQNMDSWFGEDERELIQDQIKILRVALANAPFDSNLRNLYLDAHTERAIAEIQFIKKDLFRLGEIRLGQDLESFSPFIIDSEIDLYKTITGKLKDAIADFSTVLTDPMEGVETSEIDPLVIPGTPFGYYVFQKQQPSRNATASRYFATTGDDAEQESVPNPAAADPRPLDEVLFNGYKDYTTLLTLMGDLLRHSAELNRLRGMRQLPAGATSLSDLARAQKETAELLEVIPFDLCLLNNMFPAAVGFHPIDTITSSINDAFPVGNLIEGPGTGFDDQSPFPKLGTVAADSDWLAQETLGIPSDYFVEFPTPPTFIIDMGEDRPLEEISFWNTSDPNHNGLSVFKLRFATDSEGTGSFGASIKFSPIYTTLENPIPRQSFPFGITVEARYVEFTPLDNFHDPSHPENGGHGLGLGEIAFQKPGINPGDDLDSGIFAANESINNGLSRLNEIRTFLNGESNMLGLDPDFIVLMQDGSLGDNGEPLDSFDIFVDKIKELGSNKPLTIALDKLILAIDDYNAFSESVDRVSQELTNLEITHRTRFREITGFTTTEAVKINPSGPRQGLPIWDGITPKDGQGSELEVVNQNIALLQNRDVTFKQLQKLFVEAKGEANKTVSTAAGLDKGIDAAKNTYLNDAGFYFDALAVSNGLAAGVQATTDTAFAAGTVDGSSTFFTGGANLVTIAGVGVANALAQGTDAGLSRYFEKQIDAAAFAFQTTTQKQDNALTYQQALDAKQDLLREEQGFIADSQELISALTQAQNRRLALLNELQRIESTLATNTKNIRSKSYANPIHYVRSENSLIDADSRFLVLRQVGWRILRNCGDKSAGIKLMVRV